MQSQPEAHPAAELECTLTLSCDLTSWWALQWVDACKASLKRTRQDKLALGQLHWSTDNYAPPQERVLWDALVALYDQVGDSPIGPG